MPGRPSNYRPDVVMNRVYVTALKDGAGLAAELAVELTCRGTPRVYLDEPTGPIEDDPNATQTAACAEACLRCVESCAAIGHR